MWQKLVPFKIGLVALMGFSLSVGTVTWYGSVSADPIDPNLDYIITAKPEFLHFAPGERQRVEIVIRNVSGYTWGSDILALTTSYPAGELGRPSVWSGEGWQDQQLIFPIQPAGAIRPGQRVAFNFELAAPQWPGLYREHFQLAVTSSGRLNGELVVLNMQVGDEVTAQEFEAKEVRIYRESQQADIIENGYVIATLPISSGKIGYTTPAGNWRIFNQAKEAYSKKYSLYMGNWMGLIQEGKGYEGYGIHSLAYWKTAKKLYPDGTIHDGRLYVGNRVYEDAIHLGKPMSHGCIRFGIEESALLYEWAEVGMLVKVI